MDWTHDLPTKAGYYWTKRSPTEDPEILEIAPKNFVLAAMRCGQFGNIPLTSFAKDTQRAWLGPISP